LKKSAPSTPRTPAKPAKFVVHKSGPHSFFELVTADGAILLHSELHRWRGAAEDAVVAVKRHALEGDRYQRRKTDAKQHYFVLTAETGEVLGTSAMFATTRAMESAIQGVQREAVKAAIEK
jgi:uncharacterized protein YegP (UPF0339 family)